MMARALLLSLVLTFAVVDGALAWGAYGHELATEAAIRELPAEMPIFFHQAYPRLIHLSNDPDRWRGAGPSLDDANGSDHFLDYEYVAHLDLPPGRYEYIDLLYSSGTIRRFGLDPDTAGFVVWKIAEQAELLTDQFRDWRRAEPGVVRRQIEENIVFVAGTLAHYVEDAANPHHATIHYNGWVGDPSRGFRNDCEAHSRFESGFVSRAIELPAVVSRLRPAERRADYFETAVGLIRESQSMVETLYTLDAAGEFDGRDESGSGGVFAADRLAVGASVVRDLWWSAWLRSGERP